MSARAETVQNLLSCFDDLEALIDDLRAEEWDVQSYCPEWTVRGVVTHLAGIENLLVGWAPTEDDNTPPFGRMNEFGERVADLSNEDLVTEVKTVLASRRADLTAMTDEQFAAASMTPVGPATYHRFMDIRIFDFWVHQRDMAMPLGRATVDGGPAATTALDEVDTSIGFIVGKKIGLPDGMSIAFELTGPLERTIYAAVDGRAGRVDHVAEPTVTVTTDSTTFIMLACGRIDPQEQIDAGRISWTGDDQWGETAARSLAFTM